MRWDEAMEGVRALSVWGDSATEVRGVQYDSRRVAEGDVFVAMRGGSTNGNLFVGKALERGASAVVTDSAEVAAAIEAGGVSVALVEHGRRALAEVSAKIFGDPQKKLKLSAVTGTNGKTTTAFLLEQILQSVGRKSVLLGTIETHVAGAVRVSEHTTPESRDVLALFAEGVRAGCTEAVMEMSSHALDQERVWGLPVDVAIFTNLTQDHLDYHGTMEHYFAAKAKLFAGVVTAAPRVAVINMDDPMGEAMCHEFCGETLMTYGVEKGDWYAHNVRLRAGATRFVLRTPESDEIIESPLTGKVNVYNLLAAICAASARGMSLAEIADAAKTLQQVPGRFEVVPGPQAAGFTVVVDYAHTDDALANLIALARDLVGDGGRVITLFGCGGDRDRSKRAKMGRVAAKGSDVVVVTSDNPRSEEPMTILDEVLVGVREGGARCLVEVDRRAAIAMAIGEAKAGDIVLLAGKGHEKVQVFAQGAVAFDDVQEAAQVLADVRR